MGYATAAVRGAPAAAVSSGIIDRVTVEIPAASISSAACPTDRQQKGHTGTRTTASTDSALSVSMMAGTVWSRKAPVRRR
jgi:hypothetical protein